MLQSATVAKSKAGGRLGDTEALGLQFVQVLHHKALAVLSGATRHFLVIRTSKAQNKQRVLTFQLPNHSPILKCTSKFSSDITEQLKILV